MKRKLMILPLLIVLFVVCTVSAFASNEATNNGVAVTDGVGSPNKTVKLKVSVPATFADNVGLLFTYDADVLTMTDDSKWLIKSVNGLDDVDVTKGIAAWAADAMDIKNDIFEAVFLINENAQVGDTATVTCQLKAMWNGQAELEGTASATVTVKNLAKITGTVSSFGKATDPVTVELLDGESVVVDTKVLEDGETAYEFEVEQGNYVVRAKKTKHCPREYEVSMENLVDTTQDIAIRLYGDVTGDGYIEANDAGQIARYLNGKSSSLDPTDTYLFNVADVTGDGYIEANDAGQIARYLNGKTSSFDKFE